MAVERNAITPINTVAATFEPVTVAELKAHLQYAPSFTGSDQELANYLIAAREQWESDCGVICCDSRWQFQLDQWPSSDVGIHIPTRPVTSIVSIQYVDTLGTTQTWASANYVLDKGRGSPVVWYGYNVTTPSIRSQRNAVTVTYQAGHATAAAVPQRWKQAILLLAGHWAEQRLPVVVGTITTEVPLTYERLVAANMRSTYP